MLLVVAVLLALPLLVLLPLLARHRRRRQRRRELLPDNHPALSAAIAQARATYDEFLREVAAARPDASDFCVRLRIAVDRGFEHCWFNQLEVTPYGLTGVLHTGPLVHAHPEFHDPVLIPAEDITDWGYMTGDRAVGYFTTRAALTHLEPKQRRRELAKLGWSERELTAASSDQPR